MKQYVLESFKELLENVSWPTWAELKDSTVIVAVASVIIALFVYFMDKSFSGALDLFYDTVK